MEQYFAEYIYWEDYINGMYEIPEKKDIDRFVIMAVIMLTDLDLFITTCKSVTNNWIISTNVNLTNTSCNRKAWLGQACCSYEFKVPEICTRIAWSKLSVLQQNEANNIAEKIINSFELNYERKNIELY